MAKAFGNYQRLSKAKKPYINRRSCGICSHVDQHEKLWFLGCWVFVLGFFFCNCCSRKWSWCERVRFCTQSSPIHATDNSDVKIKQNTSCCVSNEGFQSNHISLEPQITNAVCLGRIYHPHSCEPLWPESQLRKTQKMKKPEAEPQRRDLGQKNSVRISWSPSRQVLGERWEPRLNRPAAHHRTRAG